MPEQKDCGCISHVVSDYPIGSTTNAKTDRAACRFPAMQEENARLRAWKESALQVMNKISLQEIANILNLQWGSDISSQILPGLTAFKERAEKAEARVAELEHVLATRR